jgi:hypothetical protein
MDANVNANAMDIGSGSGSVPIVSAACRRMAVEKRQRGKTDADARGARRDASKRRENWGRLDWTGLGGFGYGCMSRGIFGKKKRGGGASGEERDQGRVRATGDGPWAMGGFSVARVWVLVC